MINTFGSNFVLSAGQLSAAVHVLRLPVTYV